MRLAAAPGANAGFFLTNYPAAGFLSHERLSALRNDLITLRVMGWADERPAVDYTVNSAIGIPFMTGPVGETAPVNHVLPAWDLITGAYAAFALLAADRERAQDRKGLRDPRAARRSRHRDARPSRADRRGDGLGRRPAENGQ